MNEEAVNLFFTIVMIFEMALITGFIVSLIVETIQERKNKSNKKGGDK